MWQPVKMESFVNEKCFKAHAELSKRVGVFVAKAKLLPQTRVPVGQLKEVKHVLEDIVALQQKVEGEAQGEPILSRSREVSENRNAPDYFKPLEQK